VKRTRKSANAVAVAVAVAVVAVAGTVQRVNRHQSPSPT